MHTVGLSHLYRGSHHFWPHSLPLDHTRWPLTSCKGSKGWNCPSEEMEARLMLAREGVGMEEPVEDVVPVLMYEDRIIALRGQHSRVT